MQQENTAPNNESPNRLHPPSPGRDTQLQTHATQFVRLLKLKAVSFRFPAQNRLLDKSLEYCTSISLPCVIQSQQKR